MKAKSAIITMVVLCLGLSAALIWVSRDSGKKQAVAKDSIAVLSNDLIKASADLGELRKVNQANENTIKVRTDELLVISNKLVSTEVALAKSEADAKAAAQSAQDEMAKRDTKINELTTQRDDLSKRINDLSSAITNLETQISQTEKKLSSSEKNRDFLMKELKRLQAEKAELEKQLNSLSFLREQINKLKEELSVARRLDWLRRGIYGSFDQKGGEKLTRRGVVIPPSTNFNLNVELRQDGGVKVIPPQTNTPPAQPK